MASKVLRFIADKNRFDEMKLRGAKDYLVSGTCAAVVEYADEEITVSLIRHEEFIYDPRSRREDFADARYLGVAKWMYLDDVQALYPDHRAEFALALSEGSVTPPLTITVLR